MKIYSNDEISVIWCPEKCIHARECVKGLPAVFSKDRSPWIDISKASSEEIKEVVSRCPSGTLTCKMNSGNRMKEDGMTAKEETAKAQIKLVKNGPLLVEGSAALLDSCAHILAVANQTGYRVALTGDSGPFGYNWGSNAMTLGYAAQLLLAWSAAAPAAG